MECGCVWNTGAQYYRTVDKYYVDADDADEASHASRPSKALANNQTAKPLKYSNTPDVSTDHTTQLLPATSYQLPAINYSSLESRVQTTSLLSRKNFKS